MSDPDDPTEGWDRSRHLKALTPVVYRLRTPLSETLESHHSTASGPWCLEAFSHILVDTNLAKRFTLPFLAPIIGTRGNSGER